MYVLLIAVLIGLVPAIIAKNKGRSFGLWWFYGAALFLVALPHALIMKTNFGAIERQQLSEGMKKCPHCAELIKVDAKVCRYCQRDFPVAVVPPIAIVPPVAMRSDKYINVPDDRLVESQLMEKYGIDFDGSYLVKGHRFVEFADAMNHAKFHSHQI